MIKDVTKIKIKGVIFDTETQLDFFNPNDGSKRHLLEHLKKCGNVDTEIMSWCQDIKERAAII